jgi:hypothetical protein
MIRKPRNEEAKDRYGAVKNTTTMGCNIKKTKHTNNVLPNSNIGLKFCIESDMTLLAACNGKFIDVHLRDGQNQSRNLTCLFLFLMRNFG